MSNMHIIGAIQLGNQFSVHVQMYNLLKNAEMSGERIRIAMKGAPTLFFILHVCVCTLRNLNQINMLPKAFCTAFS